MYSFLLAANLRDNILYGTLNQARDITQALMPTMGTDTASSSTVIPEIRGGWFCVRPKRPGPRSLISTHCTDRWAVLVFGELYALEASHSCAQRILRHWEEGQVEAVRRLDGSYSAIIVDLNTSSAYVVCDLFGRRSLRYFSKDGVFLVSSHDLPIVATGLCPVDYNLNAACSIVACDWSLGGTSLIKHVQTCDPRAYLYWDGEDAQQVFRPIIAFDNRIEPSDRSSCRFTLDKMIAGVRQQARLMCHDEPEVRIELTSGLDSRAVFASVLSEIGPRRMIAYTSGVDDNLDVRMARRIARAYDVRHESDVPLPPSTEAFLENCKALAFFMNGDTNSKRAFRDRMEYDGWERLQIGGGGGGLFRGTYYPPASNGRVSPLAAEDALQILSHKFPRISTLPWRDRQFSDNILDRLRRIVADYSSLSGNGYDILDMFYLFERYGRWALGARMPNEERRYFLFESAELVTNAYRLPAPISDHCPIHETIIRRFLRRTYWWPVNGTNVLPLQRLPGGRALCRWRHSMGRYVKRIGVRVFPPHSQERRGKGLEQIQAELLSTPLGYVVRDMLTTDGSFGIEMFGKRNMQNMIDGHLTGKANHMQSIGFLITLEQWKSLLHQAQEMAAHCLEPIP